MVTDRIYGPCSLLSVFANATNGLVFSCTIIGKPPRGISH